MVIGLAFSISSIVFCSRIVRAALCVYSPVVGLEKYIKVWVSLRFSESIDLPKHKPNNLQPGGRQRDRNCLNLSPPVNLPAREENPGLFLLNW